MVIAVAVAVAAACIASEKAADRLGPFAKAEPEDEAEGEERCDDEDADEVAMREPGCGGGA